MNPYYDDEGDDDRTGKAWPPAEDCPYCPSGRREDVNSPHKISCSWAKGRSGRLTAPLVIPTRTRLKDEAP